MPDAAFIRAFLSVPDPIAFRIFGLEIRWYAICIVVGMIAAVLIMMKRTPLYGISPADRVLDFVLWVIPLGVVGARLYYCLFEWDNYKSNPISIIYIHQGEIRADCPKDAFMEDFGRPGETLEEVFLRLEREARA